MIRNHKIGALSAVLFIIGAIAAYLFVSIMGYAIAGGLVLAAPNLVAYSPNVFVMVYAIIITVSITILTTSLMYKSIKENRRRLLEFSAGVLISMGGFLLGYLLYLADKKLFNTKNADIYSYMIAFSITFVIFFVIVLIFSYATFNNALSGVVTPT